MWQGFRSWFFMPMALGLSACRSDQGGGPPPETLAVVVTAGQEPVIREFLRRIPDEITLVVDDDPADAARRRGRAIAVVESNDGPECYRIESADGSWKVEGGAPLGIQYGLADALEQLGYRFFHPFRIHSPARMPEEWPETVEASGEPVMSRRGLQLHTLHPIEGLYAFWMPSPEHLEQAKAIMDWAVKNRGNYLQWVGLDDILRDPGTRVAWKEHTAALLEYARLRGLRTGLGVELFGSGNLQLAFDLLDEAGTPDEQRARMRDRWEALLEGLPFDHIALSFGEFFGEAVDAFLQSIDLSYETLQEVAPGTTLSSIIHVGNYPNLYHEYRGETYQYYFLSQFANPAITPWVHSVMYFNLFDDAGGAYHHDDFSDHRQFLLDRLRQERPVAYFPETAYWIAFDISVPTYLPIYIRSRWHDLDRIASEARAGGFAGLDQHVSFSSGWEWGYWQQDALVLRMNYEGPGDWRRRIVDLFEPFGDDGAALAEAVAALADVQYDYLIGRRLAPYLAGRDAIIDVGRWAGIASQPQRVLFDEVAAMAPSDRANFEIETLRGLDDLAGHMQEWLDALGPLEFSGDPIWLEEVRDGLEVTVARARWIAAIYRVLTAALDGGDVQARLSEADVWLEAGRRVVARRHADLHYPDAETLKIPGSNPTLYQIGYLRHANSLCYWERERVEVLNLVFDREDRVPACFAR